MAHIYAAYWFKFTPEISELYKKKTASVSSPKSVIEHVGIKKNVKYISSSYPIH